ncbi:hypothetical protein BJ508DRAFT_233275 [Ascobolus immersus RN42]|uniref:Uncharacterized protein n=1 Tax=Ascobolus immersus RN42 TaxID=1160509 RepID=A0A3N4IPR2_ASCIM|nr:hypothetical protein BJ508DRAFT_233275 [Ascobolus immersus RN42]
MPTDFVKTYDIQIVNESNDSQRFLLFQDLPAPSNLDQEDVFTNVFQRSKRIPSGPQSAVGFTLKQEYFAIYGDAKKNADGTVRVYTKNSTPAKLGPQGSATFITTFEKNVEEPDPSFSKLYIGCGAEDPNSDGSIIPVQTWIAKPGVSTQIFPHATYYICTGEYQPGMVVDRSTIGSALKIDFTGSSLSSVTFTYGSDGAYTAVDEDEVRKANIKFETTDFQ